MKPGEPVSPYGPPPGTGSKYDEDKANVALALIAEGTPLRAATEEAGIKTSTFVGWYRDDSPPGFTARYRRAREIGMLIRAEEMRDTARGTSRTFTDEDGNFHVLDSDVNRDRLIVQTEQWIFARQYQREFGDKSTITGPGGGPVETVQYTPEQARERLKELGVLDGEPLEE